MQTGNEVGQFQARPTDDELAEHVIDAMYETPHVLIGFQHLTPNRTRVMATLIGSGKYDDMALDVLLNDVETLAQMKADEEATKRGA